VQELNAAGACVGKVGAAATPTCSSYLFLCLAASTASILAVCRDLNAARECVGKVGAEGAKDPYMQLTHANVVMAALPADRSARNPADKTRRDYIYKVRAYAQLKCLF
jgi:hypothetical protein